jgi:hypothetical protein
MKKVEVGILCILLLSLIGQPSAFSQTDFKPGYIITLSNDTLAGLIQMQKNSRNAVECNFKTDQQGVMYCFIPGKIIAYRFTGGKYYVSREIIQKGKPEMIFLEYLVDGIADLFYYRAQEQDYYYIEKDSTGLVELTNELISVFTPEINSNRSEEKKEHQVSGEKYKGVLRYVLQDDPGLSKKIDYCQFGNRSLVKIATNYHADICHDQTCIVYSKSFKKVFFVGPELGLRVSKLTFTFADEYSRDAFIEGGIAFRFAPQFMHYRWNLLLGVKFDHPQYKGMFTEHRASGSTMDYDIYLSSQMIHVPLKAEYTFPLRKIKPILAIGYDNIFFTNAEYSIFSNYSMETKLYPYCWGLIAAPGVKIEVGQKILFLLQAEYEYEASFTQLKSSVDINCFHMQSFSFNFGLQYCLF